MTTPRRGTTGRTLVWLKDDLRLHDSPAVLAACNGAEESEIVFLRTDDATHSMVRPTARRIAHERETLAEIRRVLGQSGMPLHESGVRADDIPRRQARGVTKVTIFRRSRSATISQQIQTQVRRSKGYSKSE